jgi:hypothetical protein
MTVRRFKLNRQKDIQSELQKRIDKETNIFKNDLEKTKASDFTIFDTEIAYC